MIDGVAGVIIWTDDLETMLSFYRDTLGMTPNSVRPHFVSFKWGDVRLGLGTHAKVSGRTKDPFRIMVNLAVDDIHAEHERLASKGVEFTRPPSASTGVVGSPRSRTPTAIPSSYCS